MGTGSFPGVKSDRGVVLTTHPLLVPRSWKRRAIPLGHTGPVTGSRYLLVVVVVVVVVVAETVADFLVISIFHAFYICMFVGVCGYFTTL